MCRSVELDYVDRGEGVCYRLLRSVSCLQQLHHDNILPLQLVNLDASTNRLTLFYADAGTPLETVLQTQQLPIYQAKDILRQVLRALAHCHCQGITHRNLKPKYLLLRQSNRGTEDAPLYDVSPRARPHHRFLPSHPRQVVCPAESSSQPHSHSTLFPLRPP